MKGHTRFREALKTKLKDKKFREAFEGEDIFARLAVQIAKLRETEGLNQADLAKQLHTSQQMISRLEDPHNESVSLGTLVKLARAFHKRLDVEFV
ncbi:MAG: helix-turn-helix transcriptional regulator [Candidatus Omnitrophica bacterium]|nr:helix-turn-helix transcriptional regulator [Candidatus Omnitrophota bacterium]